jgi:hypothetical protein
LLAFSDVIFLPWAQFRHSLRAICYVGVSTRERHVSAELPAHKFGVENTTMRLFENSACVFSIGGMTLERMSTVKTSHFFRLHQFEYTRIHSSALLDSHGRSALNSRWLRSPQLVFYTSASASERGCRHNRKPALPVCCHEAREGADILLESTPPRNGHSQKEGIQSGIIKPLTNIPACG